ncbi:MAG: selenide, water dikinase SelD [Phenylobacterium zucineum]|nr:MAG: selenide, water dikinase SelD [Phenylobacterium zucineum]
MPDTIGLTALARGARGKLAPKALREILAQVPAAAAFPSLLVGAETADDAAVWRLNDTQALVATTDFSGPMVDDPFDFGRIAAANALSDVYAMGGAPIMALAVAGVPSGKLPAHAIARIFEGGAAVCATAGVPIAGGQTIHSEQPFYGLVAMGLVHPEHVLTNKGGREGDVLILTKPLGLGILAAAHREGRLDESGYEGLIGTAIQLNVLGRDLAGMAGVNAVTDVAGSGLIGHALEMAVAARLLADIQADVPVLAGVERFIKTGVRASGSSCNWESSSDLVQEMTALPHWKRDLLTDPQPNGGLLIAASPGSADAVLTAARVRGFGKAAIIGRLSGRSMGIQPRVRIH